jgi:diguanylate cyclase (GGDEF)-like protein
MYRTLKWLPPTLLALHLALKAISPGRSIWLDLILYNLIWALAVISISQSPLTNDPVAIAAACLAITFWGAGSAINSYGDFYPLPEATNTLALISYSLFYPCALVAIPRISTRGRALNPIEALDGAIFGLGISSIATALTIRQVFPDAIENLSEQFFSLLFPIGDLLLLTVALATMITYRLSLRSLFLSLGIAIFATADLIYLWLVMEGIYKFGQLSDNGWLLGIALIALAFWSPTTTSVKEMGIHPAFITISIFISPALLALSALRPGLFPIFVIAPAVATLFLAFIRMSIVIRQARNLGEEKVLARTDELTGLPNRRRLVAELGQLSKSEGALLLLDLDNFKPVNDEYGHEFGNLVLQQVAQRFSRSLPTGAILARLGGDEFGVIIEGSYEQTLESAYALAATLSYPIHIAGKSLKIGVSIGHVYADGNSNLLERADAAMYEAKRTGTGVAQSQTTS